MTSFLFTYVFGHFRPWEAVCEQLHASAVLTVKVSASETVWSLSYGLLKVDLFSPFGEKMHALECLLA